MQDDVTNVFGIEIPSADPFFLSIVGAHILVGMAAVGFGAAAIFSPKGRGRHSRFGVYYYWCVIATVATAALLTALRFVENLDVMILGLLCLGALIVGREAMRRRWRGWLPSHISAMGMSYVFLLMAFYVENGEDLPFWDRLPHLSYWLIPPALGAPIILAALRFHPLMRRPPTASHFTPPRAPRA